MLRCPSVFTMYSMTVLQSVSNPNPKLTHFHICLCTRFEPSHLSFLPTTIMTITRKIAESPFDDTEANFVIRTCDSIDFYVYKDILKASPRFSELCSLYPNPKSISRFVTRQAPKVSLLSPYQKGVKCSTISYAYATPLTIPTGCSLSRC